MVAVVFEGLDWGFAGFLGGAVAFASGGLVLGLALVFVAFLGGGEL